MKPWEEEIYQWGYGDDKAGDEALIALNSIIRGLYTLDGIGGGLEGVCDFLNVSKDYELMVSEYAKDIDLCELAMTFEIVRTLLFGSKINYPFLAEHLHKWGEERKRNDQSRMESGM